MSFTTNENLTTGIGEFQPVLLRELEELSGEDSSSDTFLDNYHNSAYSRLLQDHSRSGIDLENITLTDTQEESLKAATCHMVMCLLHEANILREEDRHYLLSQIRLNKYRKAIAHIQWVNSKTGRINPSTFSIRLWRS